MSAKRHPTPIIVFKHRSPWHELLRSSMLWELRMEMQLKKKNAGNFVLSVPIQLWPFETIWIICVKYTAPQQQHQGKQLLWIKVNDSNFVSFKRKHPSPQFNSRAVYINVSRILDNCLVVFNRYECLGGNEGLLQKNNIFEQQIIKTFKSKGLRFVHVHEAICVLYRVENIV